MLAAGWIAWFLQGPLSKWTFSVPERRDNRARWGLALQVVAYFPALAGPFLGEIARPLEEHSGRAIPHFGLGVVLDRRAPLQFDAALNPDHQLVCSGAYQLVIR